ncbi:hypothetical protein [Pyxidicoccus xibeiensis]|uniref:hypothetical protein n=1 Tax=Pyxidicoccus xibeiensis TaxID=2906759 RepID=UPI0020A7DF15|nr:hypothetical protein [Pyxidicoccus xibeiensis]MCP3143588.1 hypothetical protein [Pyxidicoccus xibeiensis]
MRKVLKFLLSAAAVLTLAPTAASAYERCEVACTCEASCSTTCIIGTNTRITCGRWGECDTVCYPPHDWMTSKTQDPAQQDDTPAQVCSETQQEAENSASVEG